MIMIIVKLITRVMIVMTAMITTMKIIIISILTIRTWSSIIESTSIATLRPDDDIKTGKRILTIPVFHIDEKYSIDKVILELPKIPSNFIG